MAFRESPPARTGRSVRPRPSLQRSPMRKAARFRWQDVHPSSLEIDQATVQHLQIEPIVT